MVMSSLYGMSCSIDMFDKTFDSIAVVIGQVIICPFCPFFASYDVMGHYSRLGGCMTV